MPLLLSIQSAFHAATPWFASAAAVFAFLALGARIVERGLRFEALAQFKRLGLLWQVFIVLSVGSATRWAGAKGDRGAPMQPSEPPQVIEPSLAPAAVYTNGVLFVAATSNAVDFPATNNPVNPVNPVQSPRFWHDALPGGGRVFTWENALVDRLPNRRVSMQVEMRPSGDCVFRYDFQEAFGPPATNFVIGAQMGTNSINALSILGTNILSATVWNVDGTPVTNGVAIVDLLCTNGVLRTPSNFEIRWRNTSGLDSVTDSDGDGLTDWEEFFVWNTYPNVADTDGDGLMDGGEVGGGTNPRDADENGDGLPDGLSADAWGANTLWATNAPDGSGTITITLNEPIPTDTSATLVVGDLCIPLRSPGSWNLGLNPGQIYQYRLVVGGNGGADLSIGPAASPPLRGPMNEMSIALWLDGMGFSFDGWSTGGSGTMVAPRVLAPWDNPNDGSHVGSSGICLHGGSEAVFTPTVEPESVNGSWQLSNLQERNGKFVLPVPNEGVVYSGSATLHSGKLRFGTLRATFYAHRNDSTYSDPYCSICDSSGYHNEGYHGDDLSLSVRSPLTLKHDNQTAISLSHPNSLETTILDATVQIRRKGDSAWLTLGSPSSLNPWTAKIAGTFEMRGIGTVHGSSVETPIEEVVVRFPSMYNLVNNAQIIALANTAWAETLADCSPTNRRERGFWILLDTTSNSYDAGPTIYGGWCGTNKEASVSISPRPPDVPSNPSPTASGALYPVASFHCHTPTTYRPETTNFHGRAVGPTKDDNDLDLVEQVPGLVYDYLDSPEGSGNIPHEHPINSPAGIYESLGEERRPTP